MSQAPPRRRRRLFALIVATACFAIAPWSAWLGAQVSDRVDVLIQFASAPGPIDQAMLGAAGGRIRFRYQIVPGMAVNLPATAVSALQNNPRIVSIEPDGRIQAYDAELDLAWGVARIGGGDAHASGITGAGVKVAVFDTGIEYTHFELANVFSGGYDFANDDGDPLDDNGHGTHVAGTIAGADNDTGVVGVAPGVQLYAVKVLDAAGSGNWSTVIAGLDWAVQHGIQVTNHSYGDAASPGTLVESAFANSAAAGILHVGAAGNSGNCRGTGNSVGYPARYDSVIAVGATGLSDEHACFSSSGPAVELAAPGDWIASSYLNNDLAYASGTSMASPHVAGAAALLAGIGVATPAQVRNLLTATAEDLGAAGRDKIFGFGLVNVGAALAAAGPAPPALHVQLSTDKAVYDEDDGVAVLTAVVTNEQGTPLGLIGAASFATTVDGVAVPLTFAETSPGSGTYTAALDISALANGPHSATVVVTDAQVGSDTASFVIGTPAAAGTVHVQSITYSSNGGPDGKRNVFITLTVVDGNGAPAPNALVTVVLWIDEAPWGYGEAPTNAQGQITFELRNAPPGSYYMEVWGVASGGLVWDGVTPPNGFQK